MDWDRIGDNEHASFGKRTIVFSTPFYTYSLYVDEEDQNYIWAELNGEKWRWGIEIKKMSNGIFRLSGMTDGREPFNTNKVGMTDIYWYELTLSFPSVLDFWGDQVVFRTDREK